MIVMEMAIVWLENVFVTRAILEAPAIPNVMLEIPSAFKTSQAQEDVFPRPRMGHVAASTFSESYTNVVHRTYSRTVSEPATATAQELLSAQSDIAVIYSQDCCKCHDGAQSPCTLDADNNSITDRCSGNWQDGCV